MAGDASWLFQCFVTDKESLEVCLMDITKWVGKNKKKSFSPFRNNWCDWDSCMWVPDKEAIYGETSEAKMEGAGLKFPIKSSVRHSSIQ